jgi:putative ABC transport system permease protein
VKGLGARIYRALLRLLPAEFRDDFGPEMTLVVEEQRRDAPSGGAGRLRFWLGAVSDLLRAAPREHAALMKRDVAHAFRQLGARPAFAASAIAVLALGLGAATAVYTLVDALVLRPLPVREPERLVWLDKPGFSYPIFTELRRRLGTVEGLFAWSVDDRHVTWRDTPVRTSVLAVTGEFHRTLGVRAAVGRGLGPEDDRPGGEGSAVAVLSDACWRRRFDADPGVLGRTLRLDQAVVTIVGVTPPGFFGVAPGLDPEITVPVALLPYLKPEDTQLLQRHAQAWLHVMGRLPRGVRREQADAALQVAWPQVLEAATPQSVPADRRARLLSRRTALMPGGSGFSRVRNQFAQPVWLLFALVTLVLIVACGTLLNLLLARNLGRAREMAIRLALGASRGRLVRQLLTEGLVLAVLGAVPAVALAWGGSHVLTALLSTSADRVVLDVTPQGRVLAFAGGLAVLCSLLFASVPALAVARTDPERVLRGARPGLTPRRWPWRRALVAAQVALSLVLVTAAAVFGRSLRSVLARDAGLDRHRVLVAHLDPAAAGQSGPQRSALYARVLEAARALPGVESASLALVPPVSHDEGSWTQNVGVNGEPPLHEAVPTYFNTVSPGHFRTLGTPLAAGRDFTPADDARAARVAIVNAACARAWFPAASPLGQRLTMGHDRSRQDLIIVGVAGDSAYQWLQETPRRVVYLPYLQLDEAPQTAVLSVRAAAPGSPGTVAPAVRAALAAVDPRVPARLETLDARVAESLVSERVLTALALTLGAIATLLAACGLYGVLSGSVTARTTEIGIRLALGAPRRRLLGAVLKEGLAVVAGGVAVGLGVAWSLAHLATRFVHGLSPRDPLATAAAVVALVAVSALACYVPARRAAAVDPLAALRHE